MNCLVCLASFVCLWTAHAFGAESYDILIRGGRIADGTGNPMYSADVGIKDGRIAAIGKLGGDARKTIDAKGMVVAPGFVDVHTHAEDIEDLPLAENFLRMGVTTLILGNCGSSKADLGEYFSLLEKTKLSPNVASLIGHGTVRNRVMGGSFMRPPRADELENMKTMVEKAMKDGAVGMSTGLIYLPGTFAKTDELIELAKVASAYDGIYVSHMRNEGTSIQKSLAELFQIAREAHIRAEVSHIKLSGRTAWGNTEEVLGAIAKARAEGLDITQDEYMYPASSTGLSQLIPDEAKEGGDKEFLKRITDPAQKKEIVAEMKRSLKHSGRENFDYAVIASYRKDKSLNGLNVMEAAKKARGSDSLDDQIELVLEIHKNGGASAVYHSMNEDDLRMFLKNSNTMIASDSGVRKYNEGVPHPRGYGNNARALGEYVRELKLLTIEDAVRKMSSLPVTTFRLGDRGLIRTGAWADVVVFDPANVTDHATFKEPHQYATGFKAVLVNGVLTVENDVHTGARSGVILRHQAAKAE